MAYYYSSISQGKHARGRSSPWHLSLYGMIHVYIRKGTRHITFARRLGAYNSQLHFKPVIISVLHREVPDVFPRHYVSVGHPNKAVVNSLHTTFQQDGYTGNSGTLTWASSRYLRWRCPFYESLTDCLPMEPIKSRGLRRGQRGGPGYSCIIEANESRQGTVRRHTTPIQSKFETFKKMVVRSNEVGTNLNLKELVRIRGNKLGNSRNFGVHLRRCTGDSSWASCGLFPAQISVDLNAFLIMLSTLAVKTLCIITNRTLLELVATHAKYTLGGRVSSDVGYTVVVPARLFHKMVRGWRLALPTLCNLHSILFTPESIVTSQGIFGTLDRFSVVVDLISTSEVHVSMATEDNMSRKIIDRLVSELQKKGICEPDSLHAIRPERSPNRRKRDQHLVCHVRERRGQGAQLDPPECLQIKPEGVCGRDSVETIKGNSTCPTSDLVFPHGAHGGNAFDAKKQGTHLVASSDDDNT
ncbi:hypothetical protein HD554DRAFT_2328812 [Boletus coccyginus]|nr:hypothetical protein HD554DRAFT_2328812 [Boletus coccyginus]